MNIVNKIVGSALVASLALGVAAPASAATWGQGNALRQQIAQLDRQVDRAKDTHRLSNREAASLSWQVNRLDATWRSYARGGFTGIEVRTLDRQIDAVKRDLSRQARDGNRYGQYGRNDGRTVVKVQVRHR
jgi:hypothetical protein